MSKYLYRPIAEAISEATCKVVTLEGARSVGKTSMAKEQLTKFGYSYVTLLDTQTYSNAVNELEHWVKSLPRPVIIGEAQRIKDLPMAIKGVVDDLYEDRPQFLLTGSALINREGLDGQDPLVRRVERFVMDPMTQRELAGNRGNLADDLWNGRPNPDFRKEVSREELLERMRAGGFPEYALKFSTQSDRARARAAQEDIDRVLGDNVLYNEKLDLVTAETVLFRLLCVPGGILNSTSVGSELGLDRRTIDRYIGVFLRRFAIRALPNIKSAPNRQTFAHAKIHPIDTSISSEILLGRGVNLLKSQVDFGNLFESFVVNQVLPTIEWSERYYTPFYWRESGHNPKEVDLVLHNRGQLIGIEMKSNSKLTREDFKGLARLRDTDPRFKKGYVVYTGDEMISWSDNFWAIPVAALWESGAFLQP